MSEPAVAPLSELSSAGLEQLVHLHCSVLPTLLTDLGVPLVREYYRIVAADPSVVGFFAQADRPGVVGWAVGSPDPAAINAKLHSRPVWFALQMLRIALRKPRVLPQLVRSTLSASSQTETDSAIELTYIGVALPFRGQGSGTVLLRKFLDASRAAGYLTAELSVEAGNADAVDLYTRSGFLATRSFREGRFERLRMERVL